MENKKYAIFDILGIKQNDYTNSFTFDKDAEYILSNDEFISKIIISSDISQATFYLHDSLEINEDSALQIIKYLILYLSTMMISLIKNSLPYSSVLLKPTTQLSKTNLLKEKSITLCDYIHIRDSAVTKSVLDGNEQLEKWIQDINVSNYQSKKDKYDILFLLLQGKNIIQKYMAMYAYLMSLVKEIYSSSNESQKQVVRYVSDNCSRVGIILSLSPSTRPGARQNEQEDQFTALRNKIGHPSIIAESQSIYICENAINQLASIICCAIEDIPLDCPS